MPNLTSVTLTAGIPTAGTGTVSTLDQVLAQGSPISDGTASNIVAVKAASTAPTATDKALVVAISPNSVNANGSAAAANSAPVTASTEDVARVGIITETAPASDTASSGLNGRLQRVAQRITSMIALLPTAIGPQVKAAALAVTVATDQPTVSMTQDTSMLSNGVTGTNLTPKFKVITASSSGATTIVPLVGGKKIRVLAWDVKVNAAVNFKWQSHVSPTDLTGLYYNSGQGDGVARAFNPVGYFETVAGEALDINLSGAVAVGGVLTYVEV